MLKKFVSERSTCTSFLLSNVDTSFCTLYRLAQKSIAYSSVQETFTRRNLCKKSCQIYKFLVQVIWASVMGINPWICTSIWFNNTNILCVTACSWEFDNWQRAARSVYDMSRGVKYWRWTCVRGNFLLPLLPLVMHLQLRWTLSTRVWRMSEGMQKQH